MLVEESLPAALQDGTASADVAQITKKADKPGEAERKGCLAKTGH